MNEWFKFLKTSKWVWAIEWCNCTSAERPTMRAMPVAARQPVVRTVTTQRASQRSSQAAPPTKRPVLLPRCRETCVNWVIPTRRGPRALGKHDISLFFWRDTEKFYSGSWQGLWPVSNLYLERSSPRQSLRPTGEVRKQGEWSWGWW